MIDNSIVKETYDILTSDLVKGVEFLGPRRCGKTKLLSNICAKYILDKSPPDALLIVNFNLMAQELMIQNLNQFHHFNLNPKTHRITLRKTNCKFMLASELSNGHSIRGYYFNTILVDDFDRLRPTQSSVLHEYICTCASTVFYTTGIDSARYQPGINNIFKIKFQQ